MKWFCLSLTALAACCSSCSSVDEYNYGYAPAYHTLPTGFKEATIGGKTYWHHGGRFYRQDAERGYLLVKPPRGHTQIASTDAAIPAPNAAATKTDEPSWIMPGGGTIKKRGRARSVGRSPVRRRSLVPNQ